MAKTNDKKCQKNKKVTNNKQKMTKMTKKTHDQNNDKKHDQKHVENKCKKMTKMSKNNYKQ